MFTLATALYCILVSFLANSFLLIRQFPWSLYILVPVFLFVNLFAGSTIANTRHRPLRICAHGTTLLIAFCVSLVASIIFQIVLAVQMIPGNYKQYLWNLLLCVGVNAFVFWNGILCVYLTSTQLGFRLRVLGIICGMIPIANLVALYFIIKTTAEECLQEFEKERINRQRADQRLCGTKYPILLVHGVFFRDFRYFNYWGRIPRELEANGAKIFYGNHHSASSVADSAAELTARIEEILAETKAEKVNIIAHSKGGLDCRYAIANLGIGSKIASLTTVNTPHRGCLFADYLLGKISPDIQNRVADAYNKTLRKLGEPNPDFLAAVNNLTESYCKQLDQEMPVPQGIFCQSIGSVLTSAAGGKFPLNLSYLLVNHFSGENDGLVDADSFRWGENYILLRTKEKRGISHGDIIDLNRENFKGFDVREFYVNLVNDLKNKGL